MPSTSALEYQDNVNVQFTFNPTLSLSVSGNLVIEGLTPGSSKDSNIVNVNVSSNNVAGYSLTTTTGTKSTSTDLIHDSASNYKFTNLSSNIASLSSFSDNTWGYSYSNDNGTTWISGNVGNPLVGYNGLPKDNNDNIGERGKGGITLINTNSPADTSSIQFKIGAKASTAQLAGTYTNTVNFYAVTKMPPISLSDAFAANGKTKTSSGYYKMQDMNPTICAMTEVLDEDSQTQLIDIRDNKLYWVAKLQDDHCWMTQNLDLNLDSSVALTSNDTNLVQYNTGGYVDGYSCSNSDPNCVGGVISWMPERSTIDAVTNESTSLDDISGWASSNNDPYSVDTGDWYWIGEYYNFGYCPTSGGNSYLGCNYMAKRPPQYSTYFSATPYSSNGTHGHVGNYYNWSSSVASNNASAYTTDMPGDTSNNPQNSICPAGWRLPIVTTYDLAAVGKNDFNNLNYYYNSRVDNTNQGLIASPIYLVDAGDIWSPQLHSAGSYGFYWSSSVQSPYQAYYLSMNSDTFNPLRPDIRSDSTSIRCLARTAEPKTINDLEYLQDFATLQAYDKISVLNSMSYDTTYSLKDSRDNQTYQIAKLKDNKIWMENLNLGDTDNHPLVVSQLNHTNTNLPNEPGYEISATTFSSTTEGSWKKTSGSATYTSPEYISVPGTDTTADTPYGTLYNYCAASANTYCAPAGESSGNAEYDICPAGWRLPTGGSSSEIMDMATAYGYTSSSTSSDNFRKSITNDGAGFALAGIFVDNTTIDKGSNGYYWSSTRYSGNSMYYLDLNTSHASPSNYYGRFRGFSIRCIMDQ